MKTTKYREYRLHIKYPNGNRDSFTYYKIERVRRQKDIIFKLFPTAKVKMTVCNYTITAVEIEFVGTMNKKTFCISPNSWPEE